MKLKQIFLAYVVGLLGGIAGCNSNSDSTVEPKADYELTNIQITPSSPATLNPDQQVNITFDYKSIDPDGVLIFGEPLTNGGFSPELATSPSPPYPQGSGSGSMYFVRHITGFSDTVTVIVDSVRFSILNVDQTITYFEDFVPVHYEFLFIPE